MGDICGGATMRWGSVGGDCRTCVLPADHDGRCELVSVREIVADRNTARALAAERGEQLVRLRYERDDLLKVVEAARELREAERSCVGAAKGMVSMSEWHAAQRRVREAGEALDAALAAIDRKEDAP